MVRGLATSLIILAALAFCAGRPIAADEIDVVVSIKPVHSLVAGVMQGVGDPVLLVRGTGSEHSYSLRPSQARALDQADVVFWVGETLETFLLKPLRALAGDAEIVELGKVPGLALLRAREGGMWEAHEHGDGHAEADADRGEGERAGEDDGERPAEHEGERAGDLEGEGAPADAGHAAGDLAPRETDMHLWLDPANAEVLVAAIASALGAADPRNAAAYEANAARVRERLAELDRWLENRVAEIADRPYVVFHDAYQYFERRYGVNAVGAITINPTVRPGAQRLSELREQLERLDAACVFAEPQFEPALVDTVIEGTGADKGVLDPLGADLDAGPDQYFLLMRNLADALADCLGAAKPG